MKVMKLFLVGMLITLVASCEGETDASKLFAIQLEGNKKEFKQGALSGIALSNKEGKTIGAITYLIQGEALVLEGGKIRFDGDHLGNRKLVARFEYDGKTTTVEKNIRILAKTPPKIFTYEILNTYPHDPKAYTQGLEFIGDTLYESTGKLEKSTLRKIDFESGTVLQNIPLDPKVFGEGITILGDRLYQLTWQSGFGYVYELDGLKKIENFSYGQSREGWGLCNDGTKIFKSDGTEKIWFLDPENLAETGYIETVTNKSVFNKANELEYVDGKIYANVYGKESMMIINAKSGAIEGVVNFAGLKKLVDKKVADWDEANSVLNGVAYHKDRQSFFVTGKNWDKMFEGKISER